MRTLSIAEARSTLREVLDAVEKTHERIIVTRNGRPAAVLISVDDLESLEETVDVLSDPELVAGIGEGLADIAAGRVFTLDEVAADLREQRRIA